MKYEISQYAGFCDGVKRAYEMVEKTFKDKKNKKPIFVLGSLVHNSQVVERIEKMGIKKIDEKDFRSGKKEIGTLIITAHGIGPSIFVEAKKRGIKVIDATCPKVIRG